MNLLLIHPKVYTTAFFLDLFLRFFFLGHKHGRSVDISLRGLLNLLKIPRLDPKVRKTFFPNRKHGLSASA